jgi:hypothetical protein
MYHLPLEAFACLEVWPLGHDESVLLSIVAQGLLCNFLCAGFFSSLFWLSRWRLSVESADFLVLNSVLEPVVDVELPKEVFISRTRWMSLIIEWNASTIIFYLLKNLLILIMIIFKLKCNNLIFNEIMILNASYVCLYAFSLRQESPDPDPERRTPHFWGVSVTVTSCFLFYCILLLHSTYLCSITIYMCCPSCSKQSLLSVPSMIKGSWRYRMTAAPAGSMEMDQL